MIASAERILRACEGRPRNTIRQEHLGIKPALCEVRPLDLLEACDAVPQENRTSTVDALRAGVNKAAKDRTVMIQVDDAVHLVDLLAGFVVEVGQDVIKVEV